MKKIIAKILVILILLNVAIPTSFTQTVKAAEESNLKATFGTKMIPSKTGNPTPSEQSDVERKKDNIFLRWSLRDSTKFNLSYYLEETPKKVTKINFNVVKIAGDKIRITYDLASADPNKSIGATEYGIWYNGVMGADGIYVDPKKTGYDKEDNDDFRIILRELKEGAVPEDDGTYKDSDYESVKIPTFEIKKGFGFSFKYGEVSQGKEVHFRWDTNDMFYYQTNGIKVGNIYKFVLENAQKEINIQKICSGLNFKSVPTATGDLDKDNVIDLTTGNKEEVAKNTGLILKIDIPKEYSEIETDDSFTKVADYSNYPKMKANIILNSYNPKDKQIDLTVENISKNNPNGLIATLAPDTNFNNLTQDSISAQFGTGADDNKIIVNIENVDVPGFIFDNSTIELVSESTPSNPFAYVLALKMVLDFGAVYTFPKYEYISDSFGKTSIRIWPFNIGGWYLLSTGSSSQSELLPAAKFRKDENDPTTFMFPVTITSGQFFQVWFDTKDNFEQASKDPNYNRILSEISRPQKAEDSLGTPTYFRIDPDTINFIPTSQTEQGETGETEEKISMRVRWDLGSVALIDKYIKSNPNQQLVLTYQLKQFLSPNKVPTEQGEGILGRGIKVTITKGADGKFNATYTNTEQPTESNTPPENDVNLIKAPQTNPLDVQMLAQADNTERLIAQVDLEIPVSDKDKAPVTVLEYPNVYYANIMLKSINGLDITSLASVFQSFTLSGLDKANVPQPQQLVAKDAITTKRNDAEEIDEEVSFTLSWKVAGNKLREYITLSSGIDTGNPQNPVDMGNLQLYMNLYVSQDEDKMTKFIDKDLEYRKENSKSFTFTKPATSLIFSDIGSKKANVQSGALQALRNNEVASITNIEFTEDQLKSLLNKDGSVVPTEYIYTYKLDGLDKNQKYYSYVDIVVKDKVDNKKGGSSLSNIAGITTKGDENVPSASDKYPPAPGVRVVEGSTTGTSTTIEWDRLPKIDAEEVIEYEVIRLKDSQMGDQFKGEFNTIFNSDIKLENKNQSLISKIGWRTNQGKLQIFDGTNFKDLTQAEEKVYVFNNSDTKINLLTDNSVKPNQLYFYYVRTVRTVGTAKLYSTWSDVTVTTTPVKAPKNLLLAFDEYEMYSDKKAYDKKTTAIISFDAPLTDIAALDRGDYKLQYQIKEDGKDWQTEVDFTASNRITPPPTKVTDGYTHFLYKIGGFKHSTSYYIRVRMIEVSSGGISAYSNAILFRTEIDQDEYNKDQEKDSWIDVLKKELDKLVKNPYWICKDEKYNYELLFRPSMFNTLMSQSADSSITLSPMGENAAEQTEQSQRAVYYLPVSALSSANDALKGFKISYGNLSLNLPPNAISTSENEVFKNLAQQVKNKKVKDSILKLTVEWGQPTNDTKGNVSEIVGIQFDGIGNMVGSNTDLDNEITAEALKIVAAAAESKGTQSAIVKAIKDGVANEEVLKIIADAVSKAKDTIGAMADRKLRTISKVKNEFVFSGTKFDTPPLVAVKPSGTDSSNIYGYVYNGNQWVAKDTINVFDGKGIYAEVPGVYGFALNKLIVPGLETVPNNGEMLSLISKYDLSGYLSKNGRLDIDAQISKNMAISSTCAIMGMPKGTEPFGWFKDKTQTAFSTRNKEESAQTQDIIYLTMALYEAKTGTKISSMKIRNVLQTANIPNIEDKNKQSVRSAIELGIVNAANLKPNAPMTVLEYLQMLLKMKGKINL